MTDKERIKALRHTIKIVSREKSCICPVLENAVKVFGYTYKEIRTIFPELKKHKPKPIRDIDGCWWDIKDTAIRIRVLNSMIKEIKAKSNG